MLETCEAEQKNRRLEATFRARPHSHFWGIKPDLHLANRLTLHTRLRINIALKSAKRLALKCAKRLYILKILIFLYVFNFCPEDDLLLRSKNCANTVKTKINL